MPVAQRWAMPPAYAWQLTDNAKFTQGVSVFGGRHNAEPESALNVAINEHFGLKVLQRHMEL